MIFGHGIRGYRSNTSICICLGTSTFLENLWIACIYGIETSTTCRICNQEVGSQEHSCSGKRKWISVCTYGRHSCIGQNKNSIIKVTLVYVTVNNHRMSKFCNSITVRHKVIFAVVALI